MRKLKALLYKDYLLLVRDLAGLAMMFLMPLVLVVLMTYLQDSTFNSINESRVPLILLNADKDSLGNAVERNIISTKIFDVVQRNDRNIEALEQAVAKGDYQIGIVIQEGTTNKIRQYVHQDVTEMFNGAKTFPSGSDSISILVYIDPTTKNSFRSTLMSSMKEYAASIQTEFIFGEITREVNKLLPFPIEKIQMGSTIKIKEQYARLDEGRIIPNSVQHNVPAWGMFAVFFIVISLSGNIIKEREDGSFTRLLTMPCPYWLYILSKIIVYLTVCLAQLGMMFLTGMFIFPLLGLPALELGHSIAALLIISFSASLAAIGYGVAIGKISTNNQQAAVFGSISVVILAAIGGVWIPTFIMPSLMQVISRISPLNWGLSGFYDIFVRDGNWISVLPESLFLFLFFVFCFFVAVIYDRRKQL